MPLTKAVHQESELTCYVIDQALLDWKAEEDLQGCESDCYRLNQHGISENHLISGGKC